MKANRTSSIPSALFDDYNLYYPLWPIKKHFITSAKCCMLSCKPGQSSIGNILKERNLFYLPHWCHLCYVCISHHFLPPPLQFSLFKFIDHTLDFSFPNILIYKVISVHLDASHAGRHYQALPQMTAFFFSFFLSSCKTFLSYETQTLFHNFYLLPTLYLLSGVPWNTFCPRTPFWELNSVNYIFWASYLC